ncbi:hypothetical protein Emed_005661 [Eimeria media]
MVTLKSKQRLGCISWLLLLILLSQQNHHVVASDARENEGFRGPESLPVEESGLPDVGDQERQANAVESPVSENQGMFLLMPVDEDVKHEALRADWSVGRNEAFEEGTQARAARRLRTALKVAPLAALLVMLGAAFLIRAEHALSSSTAQLRKLEALMPSAEKLSIAVGTLESQKLWASVESLLPELRQTLAEVDKKSTESRILAYFSHMRSKGERPQLHNRVCRNLEKVSAAVAALHKHARDEVEVLAKSIHKTQPSGLQAREAQLGKALGGPFADAFVEFIDSKESRVDKILRTASLMLDRSNKMPAFTGYADEPLLLITLEDITHMRRLLSQRDYAQSRIDSVTKPCARLLDSVLRIEIVAVEQDKRLLLEGAAAVYEQFGEHKTDEKVKDLGEKLQAARQVLSTELPELSRRIKEGLSIEELLDIHASLHDMTKRLDSILSFSEQRNVLKKGVADEYRLLEDASEVMRKAERRANELNSQAHQFVSLLEERTDRARAATFCPVVLEGVDKLAQRLRERADRSLQICRDLVDEFHGDIKLPDILETLREGLNEVSSISKNYVTLHVLQTHLDLLSYAEADVSLSVEMMKGVTTESLNADSSSAKVINSAKALVKKELEGLEAAQDVGDVLAAGARLDEAVFSAMFAKHEGLCLQLENEHKLSRPSAWQQAQK